MQVRLTPRLQKIAQQVEIGSKVADIGTDHGYIPLYLVENKISSFVIACDVNEKPLESARKNIAGFGYEDSIETRLSNGLIALKPGEVDTVIIAGMGGLLVKEILEASKELVGTIDRFILQPMQAQEELRRYLVDNGFKIAKDILVQEEHRIYEVLVAEKGVQRIQDEIEFEIGFQLKENSLPLSAAFIQRKIDATERMLNQLQSADEATIKDKYHEAKNKLNKLREVLLCLQR